MHLIILITLFSMLKICIEIHNKDKLMTEKELNSLGYQIKVIYSENKKRQPNAMLIIANYEQIKQYLIPSHINWSIYCLNGFLTEVFNEGTQISSYCPENKPALNLFESNNEPLNIIEKFLANKFNNNGNEQIVHSVKFDGAFLPIDPTNICVYLSSDAEDVLEDLDDNKIYIIGGLVDRNRHKNYINRVSQVIGTKCYRLPIDRYFKLNSSSVLTTNQIYSILIDFYETKDWRQALIKNIPKRKIMRMID